MSLKNKNLGILHRIAQNKKKFYWVTSEIPKYNRIERTLSGKVFLVSSKGKLKKYFTISRKHA